MPQRVRSGELVLVLDCADLARSTEFWAGVLGYWPAAPPSPPYQSLLPSDGQGCELLLQQVDDVKLGKNRMHVDVRTRDLTAEVQRCRGLGAAVLTEVPMVEDGWRWQVLADPDANEFCVLEPPASYWR